MVASDEGVVGNPVCAQSEEWIKKFVVSFLILLLLAPKLIVIIKMLVNFADKLVGSSCPHLT